MGAASRDITQRCTHFYPISCYTRPKSDRNRPCQRTEIIGPTSAPHRRESRGTSDCALWPLLEVRGCGWRAKRVHSTIPKCARVALNLCFERSGRRGKRFLTSRRPPTRQVPRDGQKKRRAQRRTVTTASIRASGSRVSGAWAVVATAQPRARAPELTVTISPEHTRTPQVRRRRRRVRRRSTRTSSLLQSSERA